MNKLLIFTLTLMALGAPLALHAQEDPAAVCAGFKPTEVTIDGQKTLRYVVSGGKQIRCLPPQPETPWLVKKASWSEQDQLAWQNFIHVIGKAIEEGRCRTVDTCLASSINPLRDQTDIDGTHYSDCADFPMYLRSYFAFKMNLPFTFGIGLRANPATTAQLEDIQTKINQAQSKYDEAVYNNLAPAEIQKRQDALTKLQQEQEVFLNPQDLRYTKNGNYFSSRINVPNSNGSPRSFYQIVRQINDQVSSGSYRMLFTAANQIQPDFYPPVINRKGITVGTVAYKTTGHVAIVYDVKPDGEVKLIDAHPDNSVSSLSYSSEYVRDLPTRGGGFKNWRPIRIENPKIDARGVITAGKTVLTPNEQIPQFSIEQYFGNVNMNNSVGRDAKWVVKGREFDWYEYVKIKLTEGVYRVDPLVRFRGQMDGLCTELKARSTAVETALEKQPVGVNKLAHPSNLPKNIYGADGDWENYSTPSMDIRIRKRVIDLIANAKSYIGMQQSRDPFFFYQGTNLKRDLIKIYNQVAYSCVISYKNSVGQKVDMGLGVALKRVTSMSFDPYFCPERRWGAASRAELATCADDSEKAEWYQFQQFLRNVTEKDPNETMGWSLSELKEMNRNGAADNTSKAANYDLFKKLNEL